MSVLLRREREKTSVYDILRDVQQEYEGEDARVRARIEALAIGTVRHLLSVDYVLDLYASVKTSKMKPYIRSLLRMSAYQVLFAREASPGQVTDHAVYLCAEGGYSGLKGFVNGVLRTIVREKDAIDYPSVSIRYSVPEWIVNLLSSRFGDIEAERICAAAVTAQPLTIRPDARLSGEEIRSFPERVRAVFPDVTVEAHPLMPQTAFTVSGGVSPVSLPGFREGKLFVQDAGAMLAALCCGVRPGDCVADVCAAPGGKALLLAQLLERAERDDGKTAPGCVYAFDVSEDKCARIRENAVRMRADNLRAVVRDAREPDPALKGKADLVLCDLPCSGLGVMGRKADIRYRVRPHDITALQALQRQILGASVSYLKPGGVLLYCTCTLTEEENEDNARYIRDSLGLVPDSLLPYLPDVLRGTGEEETAKRGFLTLLPGRFSTDGFFIARFVKQKEHA